MTNEEGTGQRYIATPNTWARDTGRECQVCKGQMPNQPGKRIACRTCKVSPRKMAWNFDIDLTGVTPATLKTSFLLETKSKDVDEAHWANIRHQAWVNQAVAILAIEPEVKARMCDGCACACHATTTAEVVRFKSWDPLAADSGTECSPRIVEHGYKTHDEFVSWINGIYRSHG